MSLTKALHRLQTLDTTIDNHRQRIREISSILEGDTTLHDAQVAVKSLQDELRPQETRSADLNLEIQSVSTQITQLTE